MKPKVILFGSLLAGSVMVYLSLSLIVTQKKDTTKQVVASQTTELSKEAAENLTGNKESTEVLVDSNLQKQLADNTYTPDEKNEEEMHSAKDEGSAYHQEKGSLTEDPYKDPEFDPYWSAWSEMFYSMTATKQDVLDSIDVVTWLPGDKDPDGRFMKFVRKYLDKVEKEVNKDSQDKYFYVLNKYDCEEVLPPKCDYIYDSQDWYSLVWHKQKVRK